MNKQEKIKTVPYLSASKMEKVLELASERSLNNITPDYFKTYGFGQADAYLAVNTLRFLGLIDDNEKATETARKFQLKGEARNKEVEATIKKAYKKLFDTTEKPHELPKDDLVNEFMHNYDLTKRIAISAVPAFLKLCEFAGLKEKGSVLTRKRIAKSRDTNILKHNEKWIKQETQKDNNGEYTPISFADGKIKLYIPTEMLTKAVFEGDLSNDLKSLTGTLTKFAEKYIIKNDNKDEVQNIEHK